MRHRARLEVIEPPAPEVPAGGELVVRVRPVCPEGCDLAGASIDVRDPTGPSCTVDALQGGLAEITLTAPARVGEATWALSMQALDIAGAVHDASDVLVTSCVLPHGTSLAVWGVPSPLEGAELSVSVGVRCAVGCSLAGARVEVHDDEGVPLAEGRLGEEPRPGTSALYEARLVLGAPERAGVVRRVALFRPGGNGLPHAGASGEFTFRVLAPPRHTVAVRVSAPGVDASIEGVEVRLGPYRAYTDAEGVARVGVPSGAYELSVWRIDIEPWARELDVADDLDLEIEVAPRRRVDEDVERMWM